MHWKASMLLIAALGTFAFVLVGGVVGTRLLLLARRTRQLPELCLGASLFAYALLAQPLIVASHPLGAAFGHEARWVADALGMLAIGVTIVGLYLFTGTVFRPDSTLARAAVALAGLVALAGNATVLATLSPVPGEVTTGTRIGIGLIAIDLGLGMSWTAWESLRYHGLMRKRLALGLADPIVTNRFLLWGTGAGTAGLGALLIIACVTAGMDVAVHPVPLLVTAASGGVIACCWSLAFFPPAGYQRWIAGQSTGQEA